MCKYNTKASQVLYYKNLAGPETELQKECARERERGRGEERERVQVGNEVGQQVENENCRCSCCQLYKKDESDDQIQYKLERS